MSKPDYDICKTYLVENVEFPMTLFTQEVKEAKNLNHKIQAEIAIAYDRAMRRSYFKFLEGSIYVFDGKIYRRTGIDVIESVVTDVMEIKDLPPLFQVESPKKIVSHCFRKLMLSATLTPRRGIVAFQNCVLDIDAGITMPHSPELECTTYLDFVYDKTATCPKWMQFLSEVVPGDDRITSLQEFLGAAFVDRNEFSIQEMLFLIGSGQNGKGVFTGTIRKMFGFDRGTGDGLAMGFSAVDLFKRGQTEYNMAAVNGKLLNICEDMSNEDFSGGDWKKFVAGEPMKARDPYGKPFMATQIPLFIASLNQFPKSISDRSDGNYRRHLIVNFDVKISDDKKDPELGKKLESEKSGIFNWIMEGRRRFIRNGGKFTPSKSSQLAVEKLRVDQDSRLQWLRDSGYAATSHGGIGSRAAKRGQDMYQDYCKYCRDNNYNAFGYNEFVKRLREENYEVYQRGAEITFYVYEGVFDDNLFYDTTIKEEGAPKSVEDDLDLPF